MQLTPLHRVSRATHLLASLLTAACLTRCPAAVVTWTGGGDGINWEDRDNWSGGSVPGANDDVTIPAGKTVTGQPPSAQDFDRTIASLTCSGHLRVTEIPWHWWNLTVTGAASVAELTIEGSNVGFRGEANVTRLTLTGGQVSFDGNASVGTASVEGGTLAYSSSRSNPPGDLTIDTLTVSSGRVSAGGWSRKLVVNTLFEINGAGEKVFWLPSAGLVNKGQATWKGAGIIELHGTFRNEAGATCSLVEDLTFRPHNTHVINAGTFDYTVGVGVTTLPGQFDNDGGTIRVVSGTLELAAETGTNMPGGTWNGGAIDVWDMGSLVLVRDTYTWTGTFQSSIEGDFQLGKAGSDSCGVRAGATGAVLNFGGNGLEIVRGSLGGYSAAIPLINRGLIRLIGNDSKSFWQAIHNEGQIEWTDDATLDSVGQFVNKPGAVFSMEGNGTMAWPQGGSIANQAGALLVKQRGTGTTIVDVPLFNEGGEVSVRSGTLRLTRGGTSSGGTSGAPTVFGVSPEAKLVFGWQAGYTNTGILSLQFNSEGPGGEVVIESELDNDVSGELRLDSASPQVTLAGGTLYNRGTLRIAGTLAGAQGWLKNNGRLDVGASPGSLTMAGSFRQWDTGTLNVELGGVTADTQFDVLDVAGRCLLDGTLNVSLINSFQPQGDDSFLVLKCGSRDGTFAPMNGLDLGSGKRLQPTWDPPGLPAGRQGGLLLTAVVPGFVVNTTGDESDADPNDGVCDVDLNTPGLQCTLRAAIEEANRQPEKNPITFDIPATDPRIHKTLGYALIRLGSPLPTVTDPVSIDGTTQPGVALPPGSPGVWLDGEGGTAYGLTVTAGNSTVRGLVVIRCDTGIVLKDAGGNTVTDCYVGTGGSERLGNTTAGIYVLNSPNNTITNCVASANLMAGVMIEGATSAGNKVTRCLIGTEINGSGLLNGTGDVPAAGVLIRDAGGNTIGGSAQDGNVVAGNSVGVRIESSSASAAGAAANNEVSHNWIGTSKDGAAGLGNTAQGIEVSNSRDNRIRDNLISGNGADGVRLTGQAATGNTIAGNKIGVGPDGTTALPNGGNGVMVDGAGDGLNGNTIGGAAAADRNVISGNGAPSGKQSSSGSVGNGILIRGSNLERTQVLGNYVGLTPAGDKALPNQGDGVRVQDCPDGFTLGDLNGKAGNVLAGNKGNGVHVVNGVDLLIAGNLIGVDASGTKAVGNQGHGVLVEGTSTGLAVGTGDGGGNVLSGNAQYGVALVGGTVTGNTVQSNTLGTNAAGYEALENSVGGVLLKDAPKNVVGGTTEAERNLISGNHFWGVMIEGVSATGNEIQGNFIGTDRTGTQALPNGAGVRIEGAPANVIGGNDPSLTQGNLISGNDTIGVWISGDKSTGNKVQGNRIGTNAAGDQPLPNQKGEGVKIADAPGNLVGGADGRFTRNVISGNGSSGVELTGSAAKDNLIQGNYIGVNADGNAALGNAGSGIMIDGAPDNLLGGSAKELLGNIVSGNKAYGVHIRGAAATGNKLEANQIGTDYGGGNAAPNAKDGVFVDGAPGNVIGGETKNAGNLISGNGANGVSVKGAADGLRIMGNLIGPGIFGKARLAGDRSNAGNGITVDGVTSVTIGGASANARNVISGNKGHGVLLTSTNTILEAAELLGNYIGVDQSGQAPLPNDKDGVHLDEAAGSSQVGGSNAGTGNLIGYNGGNGVYVASSSNSLLGNTINGNTLNGVLVTGEAQWNIIGDSKSGERNLITGAGKGATRAAGQGNGILLDGVKYNYLTANVIAGNAGHGVYVRGGGWNRVSECRIGTNAAGTAADANGGDGVRIDNAQVCGVLENVLSGNQGCGLRVVGERAKYTTISGNSIGTDAGGSMAVPNKADGICFEDSVESEVEKNLVSGNGGSGVHVQGRGGKGYVDSGLDIRHVCRMFNNAIGTKRNRTEALPNGGRGVFVEPEFVSVSLAGWNVVAFNRGDGFRVSPHTTISTAHVDWNKTRVFDNGGLGIDVGGDGVTRNDPNDSVEDYPIITSAEYNVRRGVRGSSSTWYFIRVTGTGPTDQDLTVFANATADPSGFGEGHLALGGTGLKTDSNGRFSGTIWHITPSESLPTTAAGELILTAVTNAIFSSEFSPVVLAKQVTDSDGDGVSDENEDAGANGGDANGDGKPDRDQANVSSLRLPSGQGALAISTSPEWRLIPSVPQSGALPPLGGWGEQNGWGTLTWMPFELFAESQDGNSTPAGAKKLDLELELGDLPTDANARGVARPALDSTRQTGGSLPPLVYWLYGPTPDDPSPHWYRFDYDGTTGATFSGTRMTLHFVDGGRGDDDLTVNGQIHHLGVLAPDRTADLALTGTVTPDGAKAGESLTYTLTVTNQGPDEAPGVTLTDDLPGGVELVSTTASQGECTVEPPGVTCALGTLAKGASATVTLVVKPETEGLYENTAQLAARAYDADTSNNSVALESAVEGGSPPTLLWPPKDGYASRLPRFRLRGQHPRAKRMRFSIELSGVGSRQLFGTPTLSTDLVDDGAEASATLTESDALTAGEWRWRAMSFDEDGNPGAWSGWQSFAVPSVLPAVAEKTGLSTFGFPFQTDAGSPASFGLSGVGLATWDAANQGYLLNAEVQQLQSGQGYWMKNAAPAPLQFAGARVTQPQALPLQTNWNLVSAPFMDAIVWDVEAIRVRRGSEEKTLAEAQQAGWLEDFAWLWQPDAQDPNTGAYALVYDTSVIPETVGELPPWTAFWVKANVECTLILPVPSAQAKAAAASRRPAASAAGWTCRLQARSEEGAASLLVGTLTGTRGLALTQPPEPPVAETATASLRLLSLRSGKPLAADVRTGGKQRQEWDLLVEWARSAAGRSESQSPVTVTWDGLGEIPRPWTFHLLDAVTGKSVYCRTQTYHRFTPRPGETSRQLKLVAEPAAGGALRLTGLHVRPGRDGSAAITFTSTLPALVTAQLRSPAGRVAEVVTEGFAADAGLNTIHWSGRTRSGQVLARGLYTLQLIARTDEGQASRALTTLAVR